jgi:hypothetical protein
MTTKARSLQVYEELATWYDRQGQAKLRDWFLVLAADTALTLSQPDQAERLRQRLLHVNPHHLLRPFKSFAEALQSADVKGYVADLRRNYPPETAEQLLKSTLKKKSAEPARAPAPHARATVAPEEERELKVYRGRETPEEAIPVAEEVPQAPPRQPPPPKPEPAAPTPMPAPIAWSKPPVQTLPRPAAHKVLRDPPDEDEEGPTGLGFWVSSALFVVTMLVGLALLAYSVARPFLPL